MFSQTKKTTDIIPPAGGAVSLTNTAEEIDKARLIITQGEPGCGKTYPQPTEVLS